MVVHVADRLASPPVVPVVEKVPKRPGTGLPSVMPVELAVAVTGRAVIVQVPETADTRYTLVWVGGAEEMVPLTEGVTV